jgi:negative regulator of flagellin synthesis FlgM
MEDMLVNIKGIGVNGFPYNKVNGDEDKTLKGKNGNGPAVDNKSGDAVDMSLEAKLRSTAFIEAKNAPELREDKVAALKAQVEAGEYVVDSRAVAKSLIEEDLSEWE